MLKACHTSGGLFCWVNHSDLGSRGQTTGRGAAQHEGFAEHAKGIYSQGWTVWGHVEGQHSSFQGAGSGLSSGPCSVKWFHAFVFVLRVQAHQEFPCIHLGGDVGPQTSEELLQWTRVDSFWKSRPARGLKYAWSPHMLLDMILNFSWNSCATTCYNVASWHESPAQKHSVSSKVEVDPIGETSNTPSADPSLSSVLSLTSP